MSELNYYDIIIKPIVTEKGLKLIERQNIYPFEVKREANKIQIKEAIEKIFDVRVEWVNTYNKYGKKRRFRFKEGRLSATKKAYVKLKEGHRIEFI